ncbi:winged helix-turn-helix domain-containing protein [Streptomyces sp. SID5643]|uniref:ArsR/SmtB family transcription factor n=1 Tax=Streptomyces sp. SID5643 TaxID=2690307 RepID=UPI001369FED9|nr:winged helix-turn-helix domain-containing protein [Streptomyces sp. SID5643]MZF88627.1 helix-turn-helix domain-containing protein [Streptomyces sp. SID5643]
MLRTPTDETRLRILAWLKEPRASADGVTADAVAERFSLPRPVAVTHLRLLEATGMVRTSRSAGRVRYHRDDMRIAEVARMFEKGW